MGTADARIIDLDLIDLDLIDPPDTQDRLRRKVIGHLRVIGLAALALVCVVPLGGAARPAAMPLTAQGLIAWPHNWRDPGAPIIAGGLVMDNFDGEIFAYQPDGRLAWRSHPSFDLPAQGLRNASIYPWEDSVMLTSVTRVGGDWDAQAVDVENVAIDPATGEQRWRMHGDIQRVGDMFMVTQGPSEGTRAAKIYGRLPDGLVWTAAPARTIITDLATDALLTLTEEGHFTEYELSTGKIRRSAKLTLPPLVATEVSHLMRVFRDRLTLVAMTYSSRPQPEFRTVSYDRTTLRPAPPSPLDRFVAVSECGPVLCTTDQGRAYVLDRDSLAELWRTNGGFPIWTGFGLMLWSDTMRLVDERTGQDRVDVTSWRVLHDFTGWPPKQPMTHTLMTMPVGERTYVARLTSGGMRVVGIVPQRLDNCGYREGLLACGTPDGRTGVWRLNTP